MFEVHQSSIKKWRMCKRAYYYAYHLRLQKRRQSSPLWRGNVAHNMLENKANGLDVFVPLEEMQAAYDKMFQEEKDLHGNIPQDVRDIMSGYLNYYKEDDLTPVALVKGGRKAEHKFSIELCKGIVLKGKIDQVARDTNAYNWMLDHKTHKTLPETGLKYSDLQSALYVWVLRSLTKLKIHGVCWDYIRWKPPTIPEVLKSGEMSRKAIDTTWEVYRRALRQAKLKTSQYLDMKEKLKSKEGSFFRREYLPINDHLINNLLDEARVTAQDMKDRGGVDTTRTIDRHCSFCDFYNLCQAELRGLDTEYMLKVEYKEKEDDTATDESSQELSD